MLQLFGSLPAGDEIRERLVSRLSGPDTLLQREQLLLRLLKSNDPTRVRAAVAQLASLLRNARRPDLAAIYYRQLAGPLAAEVCLDGKTGAELVAALPADSAVRTHLAPPKTWPTGVVETLRPASNRQPNATRLQRLNDLEIHGDPGPFYRDMSLGIDAQQQSIVATNGLGQEVIPHPAGRHRLTARGNTPIPFNNMQASFNSPLLNYAMIYGNMVLVWNGNNIFAIDTLRGKESPAGRVLWSHDLQQQVSASTDQGIHPQNMPVPWGGQRLFGQYNNGNLIGIHGLSTGQGVCFQRFRDLICVDPLTGDVLWTRKNLPLGCELFGDDEVVIAAPHKEGEGEAQVLRMLDGELLGKRVVPPLENRMTTVGRRVLTWQPGNGSKQLVKMTDVVSEQVIWSREVLFGAKGALAGQEAVGIFEQVGAVPSFR